MTLHPCRQHLIVGVDEKFSDIGDRQAVHTRAERLLGDICEDLSGTGVQVKLNAVLRVLGYRAFETIQAAGLEACADLKLIDVVDTMLSDIRALRHFNCIRRLTFRVEAHEAFLFGGEDFDGACTLMPDTSFLPVGPLTDNDDAYFSERGLKTRANAVLQFSHDTLLYRGLVTEVIMSPKDIGNAAPGFWADHSPVTPAVRPVGLPGNERNDKNALDVADALAAGSAAIIVASPIMRANNRLNAVNLVLDQIGEAKVA